VSIRVLIADDQDLVRAGFRLILENTDGIEVVGDTDNGRDAVTKALHLRPDVCLFDIRMPELDGIEATRLIAGPGIDNPLNVVIITTFDMDDYVYGALQAGAVGFLLKDAGPELLIQAIRAAAKGDSLISPNITTRLLRHINHPDPTNPDKSLTGGPGGDLTPREEEVLEAVADGLTNQEIAEKLYFSLGTAKAHVASIMVKLHARNRVELVIWAYETGRKAGS
jgi:DNA-binding NarL/FixJ family response regulator